MYQNHNGDAPKTANPKSNPQQNPLAPIRNIRNSSLNYYPDIEELCRHLYLDNLTKMDGYQNGNGVAQVTLFDGKHTVLQLDPR